MTPIARADSLKLLVLVPVDDTESLDPFSAVAVAAVIAKRSSAAVHAVLLGRAPHEGHGREALLAGADKVWLVSHPQLCLPVQTDQLVLAFAQTLSELGALGETATTLVLLPAGAIGEELAARLAARVNGVALGRCSEIELTDAGIVAHRPAFGGRAQVALAPAGGALFAAVRGPKRSQDTIGCAASSDALPHRIELKTVLPRTEVSYHETGQRQARLEGAKIVVSGGRGMAGPEGFALLQQLADCLGGALGGSLPSVDAGWVPVARQIGQSGKYIAPEIYIAVGISGASQHLAGIGLNTRILAINRDAEADIFRIAEIGVVADWQDVLPALIDALRASEHPSRTTVV
ncbi:MAG: electron transfer flavoprotein subunit alpha/FixB family protein [Sulfuricaulis sp.]|nr:electron transfer flavoprotein subunit alpha/FixB family protein [Sulfuricaulis sp.]